MYKNYVKFTIDPVKSKNIQSDFAWQEQDVISSLLCKYVPEHIKEIVPNNDVYELRWVSDNSYIMLLNDSSFKSIRHNLLNYGIVIEFLPG